jgi:hypothetical protein
LDDSPDTVLWHDLEALLVGLGYRAREPVVGSTVLFVRDTRDCPVSVSRVTGFLSVTYVRRWLAVIAANGAAGR